MSQVRKPDTAFSVSKRVKAKPKKKRAISAVDSIFSLCVREAADWTCSRCSQRFDRGAQNLHASHLWGRRMRAGRWNPLNVVAHCAGCHRVLGENPTLFADWIREYHGDRYEEWYAISRKIVKVSAVLREDIYQHYKQEHEALLCERERGRTGPLEIRGFEL